MNFDAPPTDPMPEFRRWFDHARETSGLPNPNAISLATVGADGQPSLRIVLCKKIEERAIAFFTNYESRKGREMLEHPQVAATFHWDPLDRQIRLEGRVEKTSAAMSDEYFASRRRDSRIGAWASDQSREAADRATFERRIKEYDEKYPGDDVPRPPHWGGFRLTIDRIEFWQGRDFRVHDRVVYEYADGVWSSVRLYP